MRLRRSVMRVAAVCLAMLAVVASGAVAQDRPTEPQAPLPATNGAAPPAPVGHRQPTVKDLPPDVSTSDRFRIIIPGRGRAGSPSGPATARGADELQGVST